MKFFKINEEQLNMLKNIAINRLDSLSMLQLLNSFPELEDTINSVKTENETKK